MDLDLVEQAFLYAAEQHAGDTRKGGEVPYLSHLLAVASLVMEAGGDDVQTAAAFLHDVAEDHGGERMLAEIESRFGPDVAGIVRDLSDSLVDTTAGLEKAQWDVRKRRYVAHLEHASERSLLVSAADKLHNARSVLSDYRRLGDAMWPRFTVAEPYKHLWYYRSLAQLLTLQLPTSSLTRELRETVDELSRAVEQANPGSTARADAFAVES